jgi:hypothetical protein
VRRPLPPSLLPTLASDAPVPSLSVLKTTSRPPYSQDVCTNETLSDAPLVFRPLVPRLILPPSLRPFSLPPSLPPPLPPPPEKLCWNERRILSLVHSPFVVCLKYAFTSKEDLFLILDLMRGGDLAFHLDKRGRFTMDEARWGRQGKRGGLRGILEDGRGGKRRPGKSRLARPREHCRQ